MKFKLRARLSGLFLLGISGSCAFAAVDDKVRDVFTPIDPSAIHLDSGILADRMKVNLEQRLLKVDEKALVEGFLYRPGIHPWIGEHAGKFLHAAALTYEYTHDERLKTLMDRIALTLISAQKDDGYLGTYSDDKRWTSWDVWSHKYDLIGLLAWYDVTHDDRALTSCKKIGDLLCNTFGDEPGKRDLSDAGTHIGMASTSVLEPMCYLYRHTGDKKYLDFCLYITRNIEKHSKVISSLTAGKRVDEVADAKAYEMLSNLVGLVELYRLTGDEQFLTPVKNGWEDIVKNHLYLSGTTSAFEHFRPPGVLPAGAPDNVGEGCVTVTWEQLNLSLLRLTGEAKYADQLERTVYNALLAAQSSESGDICYFTPLVGTKPYTHEICCCLSSEPRGIALIPEVAAGVMNNAIAINLYAAGSSTFTVNGADGAPVTVKITTTTDFPRTGDIKLAFSALRNVPFEILLRHPRWTDQLANSYERRTIDPGKSSELALTINPIIRIISGGQSYPTCVAIERGPELLAIDPASNPQLPIPSSATVTDPDSLQVNGNAFSFHGAASIPDAAAAKINVADRAVNLVTYADATKPIVFMPTRDHLVSGPLPATFGGAESQSRPTNHVFWLPDQGAITDLRPDTYRTTYSRRKADEDWYEVDLKEPASVRRFAFTQGPITWEGGWYDTSSSKPQIQVKTSASDEWKPVVALNTYPATTATDGKTVEAGKTYEAAMSAPMTITAVRIIGKPSQGTNPKWSYTSCAELAAYAE